MGKIKGWRKIKDTERVFRYESIRGNYVFGGKVHKKQEWLVLGKSFKTKRRALTFAINWMKQHPRG